MNSNAGLLDDMLDARRRTLALVEDLPDEKLTVERLAIVNPILWELGHIAFFQDAFIRGYLHDESPLIDGAASTYDSFEVEQFSRWEFSLPGRVATLDYMRRVETATAAHCANGGMDPDHAYCCRLVTLHEDMHCEAFHYTRQTLGYPAPNLPVPRVEGSGPYPGDVDVPGGTFHLGADPETSHFVFDNEKWAHPVDVADFRIAKAPVTNSEFVEFVEDGGYDREALWSIRGRVWRNNNEASAPRYWVRRDDGWHRREFDGEVPIEPHHPVVYVNFFEAEAYSRWAGRRLPTEAEWEMAASLDPATGAKQRFPWGDDPADSSRANLDGVLGCVDVAACPSGDSPLGCRQMIGNVWEWTASAFYPFPGYVVDRPYRQYSALSFGDRQVLRGGAFATRYRVAHNMYRNFFEPARWDVPAGFRTCAYV